MAGFIVFNVPLERYVPLVRPFALTYDGCLNEAVPPSLPAPAKPCHLAAKLTHLAITAIPRSTTLCRQLEMVKEDLWAIQTRSVFFERAPMKSWGKVNWLFTERSADAEIGHQISLFRRLVSREGGGCRPAGLPDVAETWPQNFRLATLYTSSALTNSDQFNTRLYSV